MSKDQESTETVVPSAEVEVLYDGLKFPVRYSTRDSGAIQRRILAQLFQAKTIEEAFDVWEGNSSDKLAGKTFEVLGVLSWSPYTAVDSKTGEVKEIPLAEVEAVRFGGTGEKETFVTTAANLVGFLAMAEAQGWFPFTARIHEDTSNSGNHPLRFARP